MANTPKTVRTFPLNGTEKDFTIPFEYLARKFVVVTLIGSTRRELILNDEFRFTSDTSIVTNKAWGSNDGFDLIEVRRLTSATERLVDFSDGSILRAYDLNISSIQSLHIAEEARDLTADTISINNDGNLDARARKIVNLASGTDDGDAVSMRQLRQFDQSALNSAIAAAESAANSLASANSASSSAAVSVSKAGDAMVSAQSAAQSAADALQFKSSAELAAAGAMQSANAAAASEAIAKEMAAPNLGAKATAPTVRRDGSPIQVGDVYLNTTDSLEYIYKASGWIVRNIDGALLASPSGASRIGGNMPVLKTMAELLAYSKDSVAKQVYLSGYYKAGDIDVGVYTLDTADTTSASNGGTNVVATDGGRWKLSVNGPVNVKMFGAKGDGTTNDYAAIQAAASSGLDVFVGKGNFKCVGKIQAVAPIRFFGAGLGVSKMTFSGASQGIAITQNNSADGVFVDGFSLLTEGVPTDGHYGLTINGTPQVSNTIDAAGHKQIVDRTVHRGSIGNISVTGVTIFTGWAVGVNALSWMNWQLQNVLVRGRYISDGVYHGVGFLVNGDGIPTDFSLRRIWTFYTSHSVLMPDYTEGAHISDFEFVHATRGIWGAYDSGWSTLPQSICGCLGAFIDKGHVNCRVYGVKLSNTNQNSVSNLNIYLNASAADGEAVGVDLTGGAGSVVSGIRVNGDNCANTKTANHAVMLRSTQHSNVSACMMTGGGSAVRLLNSSSANNVHSNNALNCTNTVSSDLSDSSNTLYANTGTGLTGKVSAVAEANNVAKVSWSTSTIATLNAVVSMNISVPVPAGVFKAKPEAVIAQVNGESPRIVCRYDYDNASNSPTNIILNIAMATGGTLPAGGFRFSVDARE